MPFSKGRSAERLSCIGFRLFLGRAWLGGSLTPFRTPRVILEAAVKRGDGYSEQAGNLAVAFPWRRRSLGEEDRSDNSRTNAPVFISLDAVRLWQLNLSGLSLLQLVLAVAD